MLMALVRTTHTKMHQVSSFTITQILHSGFYKLTAFVKLITPYYTSFSHVATFYTAVSSNSYRCLSFAKFWTQLSIEIIQIFWLFAGVYLYVNVSAADLGSGAILESPIFHPPPCYHSDSSQLYSNSCTVSWKKPKHSNPSYHNFITWLIVIQYKRAF